MSLTNDHKRQIIVLFFVFFYSLMLFKWWNGLFLYQVQPIVFKNKLDVFSWAIMETGLHQWLINNPTGCILFDIIFYSMPIWYLLASKNSKKTGIAAAVLMLLVNWVYIQCYTLFPTNSIESYLAWLLFPFLFIVITLPGFYFILHSLRYFFLFIFGSAGIWKIVQGGLFNIDQMSGVLLYQHKELLVSSTRHFDSKVFYWLIQNPTISYIIYLGGVLVELFFLAGFVTKKLDNWILVSFIGFLVADFFIMHIYYWELSPFVITLFYSRYKQPQMAAA